MIARHQSLLIFTFAVAILVACAGTRQPAPSSQLTSALDVALPIDSLVVAGQMPNGFRYLIRHNEKPEDRAELQLTVDVGSVLETADERGLAHFTEHMAFNGTKHFAKQELIDYLELIGMRFGADLNAYTSFDETVYMLTVPTDSIAFVETGFQILEDWAHGISFESEEIDRERGVVIEEWRSGKGAGQRMREKQLPIILKGSRYAERLPIGEKAVLDTFHHETIRQFYKRWYRPELMGLVAVGDFDPAWIEALIQQHFSSLEPQPGGPERVVYPVPGHEETLFAIATDPEATGNEIKIYYKQDVRDESTVGAYRRSLIERLYHSMFNKRLQELLQQAEPPFLYGYSAQGRLLRSKEGFILGCGVPDNGFATGLEALLTEAARVRQFGFTAPELRRTKTEMLRGIEQAYRERDKSQSGGFAREYVRHLLEGEPIPGIESEYALYNTLVPAIGLDEVNALASLWTGTDNRVIALNAPDKADLIVPAEDDLLAVFDLVAGKEIAPYEEDVSEEPLVPDKPAAGEIVERAEIPELGVTTWRLANGIRVFLKPTDFQNDEVLFKSYSPGGHSLVDDEVYVAAATATAAVEQGGVGQFDLIQLQKKLAGKVVSVSPFIGGLREGISGSASPQDLETMFELMYVYVTSPRPDSTAFQGYQNRMRGFIANRGARPESAFYDTIQVTMAQYHQRSRPWTLDLVDEMNLDTSMAIYRDRFADVGDFSFFFVGNFSLEEMEPLVRTYLGGLPASGRQEVWRDIGEESPRGVVKKTVRRGLEPKSQTHIVFTGPFEFDGWRRDFVLESMADVLEIRLREILRMDLGGTYGVGVSGSASHYPQEEYQITIRFGCDPDRIEELTAVVFEQIDSLKTAGTTEVNVDKVKEIARREHEVNMKENGYWVNGLSWLDFHGLDPVRSLRYTEMTDSLTVSDIQAAAQQYFDLDNYAHFVLLPEASDDAAE